MIYGLMFSGGVDSTVCLKLLRDRGITPYLFHFDEYNGKYIKNLRRIAKILSPKSPLYIWKVKSFKVYTSSTGYFDNEIYTVEYAECNKNHKKCIYPEDFVDKLIIGYFEKDVMDNKFLKNKKKGIWTGDALKRFLWKNLRLEFPLRKLDYNQINRIWKTLPLEVRLNTVSSSKRGYGEWIHI